MTVIPPLTAWYDKMDVVPSPLPAVEYGTVAVLLLCWMFAMYLAYSEPEPSRFGIFVKAAGLPGLLISIGYGLGSLQA